MTDRLTAIVLAGGRGRRIGGLDKGLQPLGERPLVAWVLERVAPQVGRVIVSANRHLDTYRSFGYPTCSDATADYQGPLAGLAAALAEVATPYWLCVPCDTPFLPDDLAVRLLAPLEAGLSTLAVAATEGRSQPTVCAGGVALRSDLLTFLAEGGRRMGAWQARHTAAMVEFADARGFRNVNSQAELDEIVAEMQH